MRTASFPSFTENRRHRRTFVTFLATIVAVLGLASCSSSTPESTSTDNQVTLEGQAAATKFFDLLVRQDTAGLDAFLSPAFQIVRADGSAADKEQYLSDPAQVGAHELSNFNVTADGNALVARYDVLAKEIIERQIYRDVTRPRLSVFVTDDAGTQIIAHANLNTPADPQEVSTAQFSSSLNTASAEDTKIAEDTQQAFFTAIQQQDTAALDRLLSPAFQLVRDDGSTATKSEYLTNPAKIDAFQLNDFVVTREGDIIVARFLGSTQETVDGQVYKTTPAPRFAVMKKNGETWQIIGQVNFNQPAL